MSGSAVLLGGRSIIIKDFFIGMVYRFVSLLLIFGVNVELMHGHKVLSTMRTILFFLLTLKIGDNGLPFGFYWVLITGLFNEGSMNGFEVLGFDLSVGLIPGGVMIVFFASSVNQHAFFILFVLHGSGLMDSFVQS
jgi:hypothetical protein